MFENLRLKPSEVFIVVSLGHGFKDKAVKGSVALMVSHGLSIGLSMINTIILARLLTPTDFGIIGMVTVVINFLIMFKDAGLSAATIQKDEINTGQISTLFWINSLISLGLGIIVLVSSPLVAAFYRKPELTAITAVLSIPFMIQGLTIQHIALLRRHLKFTTLAVNDVIVNLIQIIVSILMAFLGFQYWALVGGMIARAICLLLLTFYSCPWIPGRMQKGTGVRNMLNFGGHLTISYFLNYLARNLDKLLIGRIIGAAPLGLYTRAFSLLMQPLVHVNAPLTTLALPVLSSLKNNSLSYKNYYSKLLDVSISLLLPISVYCLLESEFLVRMLLGQSWMDAVPVFRILSIGGVFVALTGTPGAVLQSLGYSKRYMHLSIVKAVIISLSFFAGIPFGINGVAVAYTIASFLTMIPWIYYGYRRTPITLHLIFLSIRGPVFAASIAVSMAYLFISFYHENTIAKHVITGVIFSSIYIGITLLRPITRNTIFSIIKSISKK